MEAQRLFEYLLEINQMAAQELINIKGWQVDKF